MWAKINPLVHNLSKLRLFVAALLFVSILGIINAQPAHAADGEWLTAPTRVKVGNSEFFNLKQDGNSWYLEENRYPEDSTNCEDRIYFNGNPRGNASVSANGQIREYGALLDENGERISCNPGDTRNVTLTGVAAGTDTPAPPNNGDADGTADEQVCNVGALGWVICPLINFTSMATAQVASILQALMFIQPLSLNTGASNNLYLAWSSILGVANVLLAIAFLFVIFAQATSVGLSSYGVKRMLPRIIAAAILMNLSYYICAIAVDISNLAGIGISGLIVGVTQGAVTTDVFNPDTLSAKIGGSNTATIIAGVGVLAIVAYFFLVPVLIAALAVLFTLAARLAIIVLLVMVAPIAFAAWILPNTEKYFKKWVELFVGMLALFPMVMAIFAAASVASQMITATTLKSSVEENAAIGVSDTVTTSLLLPLIALLIQAMPLFILPLLFKTSSTVLSRLNDMSSKFTRGGYNAGKKAYQDSTLGKYQAGKKAERNALTAGGTYQGKNPLRRARSSMNRGFNQSRISGGFGDQRQTLGENLFEKRQSEEAGTLAKRHIINNTSTDKLVDTAKNAKSDVQRRAAMEALAQTQSVGELRNVRKAIGNDPKGNEIFNRVMSNHGSMFSSAPDLNPAHTPQGINPDGTRGYDGFGKVSAQKVAGWHDKTIAEAAQDARDAAATGNVAKGNRLASAYQNALHDPRIAPGLTDPQKEQMQAFLNQPPAGVVVPPPPAPGAGPMGPAGGAPGPAGPGQGPQGGGAPQGGAPQGPAGPAAPAPNNPFPNNPFPGQNPGGINPANYNQGPGGIWLPPQPPPRPGNASPAAPPAGGIPTPGPSPTPAAAAPPPPPPQAAAPAWGAAAPPPPPPPTGGTTPTAPAPPSGSPAPSGGTILPDGNLVIPRNPPPPPMPPSSGNDDGGIYIPPPPPRP